MASAPRALICIGYSFYPMIRSMFLCSYYSCAGYSFTRDMSHMYRYSFPWYVSYVQNTLFTCYALQLLLCRYCSCLTYSVHCSYWPLFFGGCVSCRAGTPRRVEVIIEDVPAKLASSNWPWSVAESACYAMMACSKLETLQTESWVSGVSCIMIRVLYSCTFYLI